MIYQADLAGLNFDSMEEYFDLIIDCTSDGTASQYVKKLSKAQKLDLFDYIALLEGDFYQTLRLLIDE